MIELIFLGAMPDTPETDALAILIPVRLFYLPNPFGRSLTVLLMFGYVRLAQARFSRVATTDGSVAPPHLALPDR